MDHLHPYTSDTPPSTDDDDDTEDPPEHLTARLRRALENPLRFIRRSNINNFVILGATGNQYTVTLSAAPSCTCPDITIPCKHILFVYVRLLSVSVDDPCLWRRTLRPNQLTRLLSAPVSTDLDGVAGHAIRIRYQERYLRRAAAHPYTYDTPPSTDDDTEDPSDDDTEDPPDDDTEDPPEHLTGRLLRALENPLRFIHRSNNDFFILGATGNVYTVTLAAAPSCTCPDSTIPCKHILFVYVRLLSVSVSVDDPCLWRRNLLPCELTRLLSAPVSADRDVVAGEAIRRRYKERYLHRAAGEGPPVQVEEGSTCPVCLEEMRRGDRKLVACETCKNPIHEECLMEWKRSGKKRSTTTSCVICRARWRDPAEEEEEGYINLSAYVSADENRSTG